MTTASEKFNKKPDQDSKPDPKSLKYIPLLNEVLDDSLFKGHIENFIGLSMVPIGMAGPLLLNGEFAIGNFNIPLATTEGALVASYNRGLKAARLVGGFRTKVLEESTQRSPLFKFQNLKESLLFTAWIDEQLEVLKTVAKSGSRFANLISIAPLLEGNEVILTFNFTTGDASGQNMVTVCTQKTCEFIMQYSPIPPRRWYIESNASGDKKTGGKNISHTRGKKVIAEITLSELVVKNVLKTTPKSLVEYWTSSIMSQVKMGSNGNQGHIANGLTALFLATGQDVACITEASYGINRMELTDSNEVYASLILPNLIVGTVGGGTSLPTQRECLELMDCYGEGKARKFAEIATALALAGELSIAAAIAEGHFTDAHLKLGR